MKKTNVKDILCAASSVINNPSKKISEILGVEIDYIDAGLLALSPVAFWGKQAYKLVNKFITKNQEKEHMYREIICKQQAAIKKQRELIKELEKRQRQQNAQNSSLKQQIEELKEQIENLKEVISLLGKLKGKAA